VPRARALLLFTAISLCAQPKYEIRGSLSPPVAAVISLNSVKGPFRAGALVDASGRFRVRKIPGGSYTVLVWAKGRGEARRSIDVGPAQADSRDVIKLNLELKDSDFEFKETSKSANTISLTQLAIPDKAVSEYERGQTEFSKGNFDAGVKHMERAVEIAPLYSEAWNDLGATLYKKQEYARAEECFRRSLDADPASFTPLANLGGVLINLRKFEEALPFSQRAVAVRPFDALANSQLGLAYFELGQLDNAVKYLEIAVKLDPGHFSRPQLFLAEIHARRGEKALAANELAAFLKLHPDNPEADQIKAAIANLRK
jgi:tetratricopeptide (TPR) repeat protein